MALTEPYVLSPRYQHDRAGQRPAIIEIFKDMMAAIARAQDAESGVWYQVLDRGDQEGNYLEASGSCMFV